MSLSRNGLLLDAWAALSHKPALGKAGYGALSPTTPGPQPAGWVGEHRRRLTAYTILHAYRDNVARWYVKTSSEEQRDIRREYGDPELLISQVAASVLGRGARLVVPGAEDDDAAPSARQTELLAWAEDELLRNELLKGEQKCQEFGDITFHLVWSSKRNRVRLHVLEPGFYFPVYPPADPCKDYPEKVHLAWEYEEWDPVQRKNRQWVERITYELVDWPSYRPAYQSKPATRQCLMTQARWSMDRLNEFMRDARDVGPEGFMPAGAQYIANEDGVELNQFPTGLDFIPVVHVANFGGEPWGRSILTSVAHILDDLQMADTDSAEAADVAGSPPIVVAGSDLEGLQLYGPKTAFSVPTGGQASVLDTGKGLTSLHEHRDFLSGLLCTNSRVPEEILGRVGADDVPSGTTLALSFSPFKVLIEELRLTRGPKLSLLLKFVQRMMIAGGAWQAPVVPAVMEFGAALPEDVPGLVSLLKELASADRPIISRTTALGQLAEAFGIEDVAEELDRVHQEDFDAARLIGVATKSGQLAADHLGLELPDAEDDPTMAPLLPDPAPDNASGTVTNTESTSQSARAGTGTRNPGASSGSNSERSNSRRNRRRGRGQ